MLGERPNQALPAQVCWPAAAAAAQGGATAEAAELPERHRNSPVGCGDPFQGLSERSGSGWAPSDSGRALCGLRWIWMSAAGSYLHAQLRGPRASTQCSRANLTPPSTAASRARHRVNAKLAATVDHESADRGPGPTLEAGAGPPHAGASSRRRRPHNCRACMLLAITARACCATVGMHTHRQAGASCTSAPAPAYMSSCGPRGCGNALVGRAVPSPPACSTRSLPPPQLTWAHM